MREVNVFGNEANLDQFDPLLSPTIYNGSFLLADGVHAKLDTPRAQFFREGTGIKRNYHLVKCTTICRPKKFGGLPILNSNLKNVAFLTKWWWHIAQNESRISAALLYAKYFPNGNLFTVSLQDPRSGMGSKWLDRHSQWGPVF